MKLPCCGRSESTLPYAEVERPGVYVARCRCGAMLRLTLDGETQLLEHSRQDVADSGEGHGGPRALSIVDATVALRAPEDSTNSEAGLA